jgi:uncharacterized protein YecT (DUF1311 family)
MDEILKDLWTNLQSLNGTQWIIVVTLSIFIGAGLFFVFRWLYGSTFEAHERVAAAQKTLIELKDQTIQYYASANAVPDAASSVNAPLAAIAPADWDPFVEQAFDYLHAEVTEGKHGQQGMNRISADMGFVLDAGLFVRYVRIFERLSPTDRAAFRSEQSAWIDSRSNQAEDAVESNGGSLAPLEYNLKFVEITQTRIAALDARLKQLTETHK